MDEQDIAPLFAKHLSGYDDAMGVVITSATPTRVEGHLVVAERHRQIHGVVHGAVFAGLVETFGSVGALASARREGKTIVGLENHTSFLRAVREGKLHCVAEPLTAGRRTQVWEVTIRDDSGRKAAVGQLRTLLLAADAPLAGQPAVASAANNASTAGESK